MPTEIGTINVRRSAWIDASPERVWQEFETFERFKSWYGVGHDLVVYEPREGGRLEFESEPYRFGGEILVFDPPRELTFEDGYIPRQPGAPVLLITYRLTTHLGGTHVEFFVHGFEAIGDSWPERLEGLEEGWTTLQLRRLQDIVEGRG
jgi:uncharacterized protein YndB with AHSA1/START domain